MEIKMEDKIKQCLEAYKKGAVTLRLATQVIMSLKNKIEIQFEESTNTRQDRCNHDFGAKTWYGPCLYTHTCRICGYNEEDYERD